MKRRLLGGYVVLPNGCWQWVRGLSDSGYGRIQRIENGKNKQHKAHRVSYEYHKGAIPEGLCLDHLCRNRACVNPAHLEPVTRLENTMRSARAGTMIHKLCKRGHELTENNIYVTNGIRSCKVCHLARCKAYYERRGRKVWAERYQKRKAANE